MIKSIHIQNFQSHSDTILTLDPGVNLICGSSDGGKSAIIRALKWLATNRPLGDGFASWGSKGETAVEVLLDDGVSIMHEPGSYSLIKGKDRQDWSAIGTGVPETVTQALNISELSWQAQMDAPFLLSASPGEVARTLNEVADLDKIDSTLVNINRMARDNRSQLTETASRKQQLEIELSQYRGLDRQLKMIASLKEMERKADALDEMIENWEHIQIELSYAQTKLVKVKPIAVLGDGLTVLMSMEKKVEGLETLTETGERLLYTVGELNGRLSKVKDTTDAEAELDLLLDMTGKLKDYDSQIDKMENRLADLADTKMALQTITGNLKRLETKWHEQFPDRCPLCGK
jgi:exonuclease SbcC